MFDSLLFSSVDHINSQQKKSLKMEEIKRLQAEFAQAQESGSASKLSERNMVQVRLAACVCVKRVRMCAKETSETE